MKSEENFIKIHKWLLPISWIYGLCVYVRNKLFDKGILKENTYNIPIISVGNITVGGTGKTPHIEYLIKLLKETTHVAVLSRGYKRKSHGYILADITTPSNIIGDEPYQIKQKFKDIYVAVDKDRCDGIEHLTNDDETKDVGVVLLDDAFQHRYVKPGINILLVDYNRLIIYDKLLPAGRLREPLKSKDRADIIIITKCPKDLKPMEFRVLKKAMRIYAYQDLFFTTINYSDLQSLFYNTTIKINSISNNNILLLTGIASPKQMLADLKHSVKTIETIEFGDHHFFNNNDIELINKKFSEMPAPKIIITTEKDAARIVNLDGLSNEVRECIFSLPITMSFMLDQQEEFNNIIINYVRGNKRNSKMAERQDDNKSKNCNNTRNGVRTISFRNN